MSCRGPRREELNAERSHKDVYLRLPDYVEAARLDLPGVNERDLPKKKKGAPSFDGAPDR
jgi:hypothetical protein